jgi:hypothetical protein
MTNHVLSKPDVEVNGVVIEELKDADVDVTLTQAQQAKAEIPLMADNFKEKEPRKPKTKNTISIKMEKLQVLNFTKWLK